MAHHVVERFRPVRCGANLDIEQKVDDFAFIVIRNLIVDRVFVLPVILDPRVEARFFDARLKTSGTILQTLNLRAFPLRTSLSHQSARCTTRFRISRAAFGNHRLRVILVVNQRTERVGTMRLRSALKIVVRPSVRKSV